MIILFTTNMFDVEHTQVLVIVTASVYITAVQTLLCTPGEMFQPLNITLNRSWDQIVWLKDNSSIASCFQNVCVPEPGISGYTASASSQTSTLTIFNVTRESAGTYTCDYGINTSCDLKVFARAQSVSCEQAVLQADTVTVVCTVTRIFPNPVCQFVWAINNTERSTLQETVIYKNLTENRDQDYFNMNCSLKLSARSFSVGTHRFQVRVYPHVTGSDSDSVYGTDSSWTSPQSVAIPSVKLECTPGTSTYVEEGKSFSCTCRETANNFILSATTLSYGSARNSSTQNVAGIFIANRNIGELTCEAHLPDGTQIIKTQTTQVAFGPSIFNFEANHNSQQIIVERNSIVSFSCQAEGNPSPRLSMRKNGTELAMSTDATHKFNQTLTYGNITAECLDTGVYTCLAVRGQTTTNKTVAVYVKCKPEFRHPTSLIDIHPARVNGTVSVCVPVFGYPEPNVTLSSTNYTLSSDEYRLAYLQQDPPYGNVSLTINITNASYFQNYILMINNTEGPLSYSFEIVEGDPVKPDSGNNDPTGTDVGAIVGGIVAAVLVLVIIFVIIFFLKRKGASCNKKQQNGNILMHTPYSNESSAHVSEELPQVEATEPPQYEEINDVQYDMPDGSEYFTNQIPNIRDEEVQYVNTV